MKKKVKCNQMTVRQAKNALLEMVRHNIKAQYRNSWLGVVWTLLHPLLNMIVLAIVFTHLLSRRGIDMDYPLYIMTGNVVFAFMRMATVNCLPCFVSNRDLLTKTRIPYSIFPLSQTLSASINMIFSLIAVLLVMLVRLWMHAEIGFYWSILMFFPYFPSLMLFSLGMGLVLSTIYVRFRDIKHIYSVFLTLWTYGTPLFYSEAILSDKVRKVMMFNPMYYYVKYFREVVAMGVWNDWRTFGICYGFGALALCVGLAVFVWRKKYIALYV